MPNPLCLPRKRTSERQKVVRTLQFFTLLTWKCASRHNGVHFFDISTSKSGLRTVCLVHLDLETCFAPQQCAIFISHLTTWLRTRRFSEPTCRRSGATNHWEKSESRLFYLFAPLHLLFSHIFSPLISSLLHFSSLTLSASAFPSAYIIGSLTS